MARASAILGVYAVREWAALPLPSLARKATRFAARGDAGPLVMTAADGEDVRTVLPAILYAAPERRPYGRAMPLMKILRRIQGVAGMQTRSQGEWWGRSSS